MYFGSGIDKDNPCDLLDKELEMAIDNYNERIELGKSLLKRQWYKRFKKIIEETQEELEQDLTILLNEKISRIIKDKQTNFKNRIKREIGEVSFSNKNIDEYIKRNELR